ncbi:hypothetical protein BV22DRAFT_848612 [Leucogyrophana mollusca]|uniref:Uncharacterized protein n=1 Tax=Leucogyrophana mollusca TaxID=85980 RepID=A0ACB8B3F5_9AGAM|nr:hypothetical protein BV22DRAFT_848612 [Leucogyrophana mollusca]
MFRRLLIIGGYEKSFSGGQSNQSVRAAAPQPWTLWAPKHVPHLEEAARCTTLYVASAGRHNPMADQNCHHKCKSVLYHILRGLMTVPPSAASSYHRHWGCALLQSLSVFGIEDLVIPSYMMSLLGLNARVTMPVGRQVSSRPIRLLSRALMTSRAPSRGGR